MDRLEHIEGLIEAGVTSFKIEGRLKDVSYVKNITALYRKRIDQIIESKPGISRTSSGKTVFSFEPDAKKTFHRGATPYFDNDDIASSGTSKSIGESLGTTDKIGINYFTFSKLSVSSLINNGDGLCFFNTAGDLRGMQVVKTIDDRVLVHTMPEGLTKGTLVYRNHNHNFLKQLEGETAQRKIGIDLIFKETENGFELIGTDEDSVSSYVRLDAEKIPANKPETAKENIRKQLSKLGDTIFKLGSIDIRAGEYFLSVSQLNSMRRELTAQMEEERIKQYCRPVRNMVPQADAEYPETTLDYSHNVINELSRSFYLKHGVNEVAPGFEMKRPETDSVVMTARLCLRKQLNACPKQKDHVKLKEPLEIENSGRLFGLKFDCSNCRMEIVLKDEDSGG
jgi:putative protease